ERVHPLLEFYPVGFILVVVAADESLRNLDLAKTHVHRIEAPAEQVPEARYPARVVDGDVDDAVQLLPHGVEHEGDAPGLGLEQMPERRLLLRMLGRRQARAFEKIEHRHRVGLVALTGLAGSG